MHSSVKRTVEPPVQVKPGAVVTRAVDSVMLVPS